MDVFPLYHLNCVSCRVRLPAQSCALGERSSHHWGDPSVSSTSANQKPPAVSLQGTITSENNHLCVSVFNPFHTLTQSKSLHTQYLTLWAIKQGSLVMTPLVLMLTFGLNIKWLVRHRWCFIPLPSHCSANYSPAPHDRQLKTLFPVSLFSF